MSRSWNTAFRDACIERREAVLSLGDAQTLRELDAHQVEAMDAVVHTLDVTSRKAFSIIHSAGSGKTTLEANLLGASLQAGKEMPTSSDHLNLVITTERALVSGVREEIASLGIDTGIWGRGQRQLDRPVVVASIQALQHNAKHLHVHLPVERTDLIIGDEADLFLTKKRASVIQKFQNALRIGFTATETWPDGRTTSDVWGEKIHELPLDDAILEGINVAPLFYLFEARLDADQLRINGGDYDAASLEAGMRAAEIERAVPEVYRTLVPTHRRKEFPTLTYVSSRDLVYATLDRMREEFSEEDVRVAGWTGLTSNEEMKRDLMSFRSGEIDMLILCEMGGRGIDLPRARCLIDAYPTLSRTKLQQRHGRVLRQVRPETELAQSGFSKPYALIGQIIPHATHFRSVCFPDLLEDEVAWNDVAEGRILLAERRSLSHGFSDAIGRPLEHDVHEVREWIAAHRKNVRVTKLEEIDIFRKLALREELPQADADGFIRLNEKRYGTIFKWSIEFGINDRSIRLRLTDCLSIPGKDLRWCHRDFYEESLVRDKCQSFIESQTLPQADETGFFKIGEKRYGTIPRWAKDIGVSCTTMQNVLEACPSIIGLNSIAQKCDFYEESVVRERCKDLITAQELPQADTTGFFELGGKRYGTINSWKKEIDMNYKTVQNALETCPSIKGKSAGQIWDYYEESLVREKCRSFIESQALPQANETGFFELGGKRYGTIPKWSNEFGSAHFTVRVRLRDCHPIIGREYGGKKCDFYEESLVRERCKDLIGSKELPQADETGFFELAGKRYGTVSRWAKDIGVSGKTVQNALEACPSIKGKNSIRRICDFYEESVVRERCKDLIIAQELPEADEKGFCKLEGKRYGTMHSWKKEMDVSQHVMQNALEACPSIKGKNSGGQIWNYYEESLVRERCKDLIKKKQ